jgi:hypothetical protein
MCGGLAFCNETVVTGRNQALNVIVIFCAFHSNISVRMQALNREHNKTQQAVSLLVPGRRSAYPPQTGVGERAKGAFICATRRLIAEGYHRKLSPETEIFYSEVLVCYWRLKVSTID